MIPMRTIDLRSDTVTLPTQAMRDAMYAAEVGDDVYLDDPAINRFEELSADILGKEAALLVTSGTQGNIVSVMSHTRRGDAIIIGRDCHIAAHEAGSYAMLAGVSAQFPKQETAS
jgi:threonine aldolase